MKTKFSLFIFIALFFCCIITAKSQVPPLYLAIESGDVDVVKGLLNQEANVNQIYKPQSHLKYTPLIDAVIVAKKNGPAGTQIVKILLNKGADVNARNQLDQSVLDCAIMTDNSEVVKILLDNGAKIDGKDQFGRTQLMLAASRGQAGIVQILLDKGANVNIKNNVKNKYAKNEYGQSALFYASTLSTAKLLIAHGADVLAKDNQGKTALDCATENEKKKEISSFLLRYQSEGNNPEGKAHKEAVYENLGVGLIEAVKESNLKGVIGAIEKGADVNFVYLETDYFGFHFNDCTPLSLAAHKDNIEIAKLLLEKGADIKIKDREGKPFLDFEYYSDRMSYFDKDSPAAKNDHKYSTQVQKLLKEHAKKSASPLWTAIARGDNKMVEILLTGGEDANKELEIPNLDEENYNLHLQTLKKISPIICAMWFGRMNIIKTLLENGADISGYDTIQDGLYAFHTMPMGYAQDSLQKEGQKLCAKDKDKPWHLDQNCYQEFLNNPKIVSREDDINKKRKEIRNIFREWYIQKKGCYPSTFIIWAEDTWFMDLKLLAKICDPNAKIGTAGYGLDNLLVRVAMPSNDACTDLLIAKGANIDKAIQSCRAAMANNPAFLKDMQDKIDFLESKKKKH